MSRHCSSRNMFYNRRAHPNDSGALSRFSQGFTLTELTVVTVIIMLCAMLFFNRAKIYQERAEKTAMTEVAGAIQNQLLMNYGHLLAQGKEKELATLATENPMSWMEKAPDNYAGEFDDPSPETVAPGNWLFDLKSRELIYLPEHSDNLVAGTDGEKWVRYRVRLKRDSASSTSGKSSINDALFGPSEPYYWFDPIR